jgi:hypothetical protein
MNDIELLVKEVKQATDFQINKTILREKILTDLHITYNNGMFLLTKDLLAFVATWPDNELYLEDVYQNPILIDKNDFLTLSRQHYHKIMNSWSIQYNELKNKRKV